MNISIQSSNPALAALEALLQQGGAASAAGSATTQATQSATPQTDSSATIVALSGGASSGSGLTSSLISTASAADAAVSAGGAIETLLAQMRQDAQSASEPGLAPSARAALDSGFQADMAQVSSAVSGASVGGLNLIDGSAAGGSSSSLSGIDLSLGGPLIGLSSDSSLSDPTSAAAIADQLGTALGNVGQAVGQIAAQGQALNAHLSLLAQASLAAQPAVAGSVNSGLDADGARLTALQVSQQLSASSSPITSPGSQGILALFR